MKGSSRRPATLPQGERFEIASALHAVVLDELFRATRWLAPMAVFHGGTSLALVRESTRFSEDLDFLLDERAASDLAETIAKLQTRLDLAMSLFRPGGAIELRGPRGKEVVAWQVVWSAPQFRDVVRVKVEFFVTRAKQLEAYRASHQVPRGRSALVTTPVPVPELVSAWADKIKAIATRADFKWRDAYDVWWITRCLQRGDFTLSEMERVAALTVSAALYDKTLRDLEQGLDRVVAAGALDDLVAFEADMRRWFSTDVFSRYRDAGVFREALASTSTEVERARTLIREERSR